jgi:hypothetical protein
MLFCRHPTLKTEVMFLSKHVTMISSLLWYSFGYSELKKTL